MEVANTSPSHLSIFGGGRTIPLTIEGGSANSNGEKKKKKKKNKEGLSSHPFWPNGVVSLWLLNKPYFFVEPQNSHSHTI
jgi:hypothetical protein